MANFTNSQPKIEIIVTVNSPTDYQADIYEINAKGQTSYRTTVNATPALFATEIDSEIALITPAP